MHRRMIWNFENELSLWDSAADIHLMIAATFTLTSEAQTVIDELSLLPTSGQWIPADDAFELRLVDPVSFTRVDRSEITVPQCKGSIAVPGAMLLDVRAAPVGLCPGSIFTRVGMDVARKFESGSRPDWLWPNPRGDLPTFPQYGEQSVANRILLLCSGFSFNPGIHRTAGAMSLPRVRTSGQPRDPRSFIATMCDGDACRPNSSHRLDDRCDPRSTRTVDTAVVRLSPKQPFEESQRKPGVATRRAP